MNNCHIIINLAKSSLQADDSLEALADGLFIGELCVKTMDSKSILIKVTDLYIGPFEEGVAVFCKLCDSDTEKLNGVTPIDVELFTQLRGNASLNWVTTEANLVKETDKIHPINLKGMIYCELTSKQIAQRIRSNPEQRYDNLTNTYCVGIVDTTGRQQQVTACEISEPQNLKDNTQVDFVGVNLSELINHFLNDTHPDISITSVCGFSKDELIKLVSC